MVGGSTATNHFCHNHQPKMSIIPGRDVKRMLARDGKELPIGKTHLDNVLRAMTEGGT